MFSMMNRTIACLLVGAMLALSSGCSMTGPERAAAAADSLNGLNAMAEKTDGQLQTAVAALSDLVEKPKEDLKPQFRMYVDSLDALDARIAELRAQSEKMKAKGQTYFLAWEQESQGIKSQELKAHAAERRTALSTRYEEIKAEVQHLGEIGKPLVASLKDVQTVLSLDLSSGGLKLAADPAAKAKKSAAELKSEVEKLRAQLAEVAKLLAPAAAPPKA